RLGTQSVATHLGRSYDEVAAALSGPLGRSYRCGRISKDAFWQAVQCALCLTFDAAQASRLWHDGYQVRAPMLRLVRHLRDRGTRVVYLSDNIEERTQYLDEKFDYLREFDGGVFSFDFDSVKPHRILYEAALELCAVPAAACVYADDKIELLQTPTELGIQAIHFTNVQSFLANLVDIKLIPEDFHAVDDGPTRTT
ncbi:MAG: hypothetical protein K0U93_21885, partial [Gammaproteobacteria bacterium]|nr:hypothetical protein [Gammaproteobacteria bacterium]